MMFPNISVVIHLSAVCIVYTVVPTAPREVILGSLWFYPHM